MLQDAPFARRKPGFAITAVLVLSLGLGANSAIFSVINALLLRPLPYRDPDCLAALYERNITPGEGEFNSVSPGARFDWRAQSRSFLRTFEQIAACLTGPVTIANTGDGLRPERVDAARLDPTVSLRSE